MSNGWAARRPNGDTADEKYRRKAHLDTRAAMKRQLEQDGSAQCAQPICILPSRLILPGMEWDAGHAPNGVDYIGLVHRKCNRVDGAKVANRRSNTNRYLRKHPIQRLTW